METWLLVGKYFLYADLEYSLKICRQFNGNICNVSFDNKKKFATNLQSNVKQRDYVIHLLC